MKVITCLAIGLLLGIVQGNNKDVTKWLYKYGYVAGKFNPNLPVKKVNEGLKKVQIFAGLSPTGVLDKKTKKLLGTPRCGRKDPIIKIQRGRRYVHQGSRWNFNDGKTELRWTLRNSGRSLPYGTVSRVMRKAFRFWQEQTNIDFVEIPKSLYGKRGYEEKDVEILVSFETGGHGDPYYFDGQGGTLAHAFYPHTNRGLSGDVHFDDAEYYTYESARGRNLLWVATHEIGHSLGLEHSNVREAVMFPWYTKYKPGFKLHNDDILGIQTLYGSRVVKPSPKTTSTTRRPTTKTTTTRRPTTRRTTTRRPVINYRRKCVQEKSGDITAIFYSKQYGQYIAFTSRNKLLLLGYKDEIKVIDRFRYIPRVRVPDQITAVLTADVRVDRRMIKNAQVYFAGSKYYIYKGFRFIKGPYSIHNGDGPLKLRLPGNVRKVDSAIKWYPNGKVYLFAGKRYWRIREDTWTGDGGYPRYISKGWKGAPQTITAASSDESKKLTFFISNNKYYVYDRRTYSVTGKYELNQFLKCNNASPIRVAPPMLIGGLSVPKDMP